MGITKPCTHLHPAPSISTQPHPPPPGSFQPPPSPIHLHLAHFSLHPALCNTLNNIRTKISNVKLDNFPKFRPKNTKLSVLSESWHAWYLKDADSYSNINFLKFRSQIPFLGKFGRKKSNLSVLSKYWDSWYFEDAHSYFKICFLNFQL